MSARKKYRSEQQTKGQLLFWHLHPSNCIARIEQLGGSHDTKLGTTRQSDVIRLAAHLLSLAGLDLWWKLCATPGRAVAWVSVGAH